MDGVEYDLNAMLNSIPLATDDEGPVKDSGPSKRRKTSDKGKGSASGKELLTTTNVEKGGSRGRNLKDVPVDLPDDDPLDDETTFHNIPFLPTNANRDLELVQSFALEPLRTGLSRRKVSSVNKTLAVYTKRDSMALACENLERHLEHMDLQEAELRTEVDNLKKEIGEKNIQAKLAESRATLARAQEYAISSYKASSEFSSCMHMYGAESMKASISLTKKWLAEEYPSIDPLGLERFMARQRTIESASKKSVPKGRRDVCPKLGRRVPCRCSIPQYQISCMKKSGLNLPIEVLRYLPLICCCSYCGLLSYPLQKVELNTSSSWVDLLTYHSACWAQDFHWYDSLHPKESMNGVSPVGLLGVV
ncbi:Uncharacterized protein Adt_32289 [Abeliophyllum distichum]|uniref:Uncharacterized protein n=1 Tax=Abeliophyllum distichum TaxID=126358 RepID=A0ABD1QT36_9LAMI